MVVKGDIWSRRMWGEGEVWVNKMEFVLIKLFYNNARWKLSQTQMERGK